jgi:hypothetical protein
VPRLADELFNELGMTIKIGRENEIKAEVSSYFVETGLQFLKAI